MTSITLSLLLIYLFKRSQKNGRVKWNILRKSSLNFFPGHNDCHKSDFTWPNSRKAVLLEISQDWSHIRSQFCVTFWQLWLLNFMDVPGNFSACKINVLNFSFTTASKKFWIRLWTVMNLFCSMSKVAGWWLLKKNTKHAS